MSKFIEKHIARDGKHVEHPELFEGERGWENLAHPNVYVAEAQPQYPVGARFNAGERVFYYARYDGKVTASTWNVVADTDGDDLLGKALFNTGFAQDYASSLVQGTSGESVMYIWDTVNSTNAGTERANDFYSGGWVNGKDTAPSDARMFSRYITKSEFSSSQVVGGTARSNVTTLTLEQPLVNTFTALTTVVTPNPWKHAAWFSGDANKGQQPVLGVCMVNNPTANYYVWLQTYGPIGSAQITNAAVGAIENEISYYIMADGSFQGLDAAATDTYGLRGAYTFAGYSLPSTIFESGSGQDESYPIIDLRIKR